MITAAKPFCSFFLFVPFFSLLSSLIQVFQIISTRERPPPSRCHKRDKRCGTAREPPEELLLFFVFGKIQNQKNKLTSPEFPPLVLNAACKRLLPLHHHMPEHDPTPGYIHSQHCPERPFHPSETLALSSTMDSRGNGAGAVNEQPFARDADWVQHVEGRVTEVSQPGGRWGAFAGGAGAGSLQGREEIRIPYYLRRAPGCQHRGVEGRGGR